MFISIEGTDGSGKATQAQLLVKRLQDESGVKARLLSFPVYDSPSSTLVKMYLAGEFGANEDVNPYAASTFYAVDRYASFASDWRKDYEAGTVIVSDRYVGSNAIHQGQRFENPESLHDYLDWLYGFEYGLLGLPKPDLTIWLDVPPEVSLQLMEGRLNKATGGVQKDILESDRSYTYRSYMNSKSVAEMSHWKHISCVKDGKLLSVPEISDLVWAAIH